MIFVCIPVHDEAPTVGPLLWKLRKLLTDPEFRRDFRIVVMDDASTDDTKAALERYRKVLPLTVLRSDERLGYGRAVDRLLRHAADEAPYSKRDCAVVLQADFTDDPAAVVDLVKTFEGGADIVAGAVDGADPTAAPGPVRWARRLAPWVLGRSFTRAPVADPLCGLRAYRVIVLRKALDAGEPLCGSPEPWAANLEVLRSTAPHARRIAEVPVRPRYPLRVRPSRFRTVRVLRSLFGLRGGPPWSAPGEEAA